MTKSVMSPGESWRDGRPLNSAKPTIGTILVVVDRSMDMGRIIRALKAHGLWPVMSPLARGAIQLISRWQPQAVVLQAGGAGWLGLLRFLGRRGVPSVLLGTAEQLRRVEGHSSSCVHLLVPVEPAEIAQGVQLVVGPPSSAKLPDAIDLGLVKIDLCTCTVEVEGDQKALPPKEFKILVQLALQPGAPLNATELLGRVWPGSASATVDDLHTGIWRLRRMLGDHDRPRPLIVNRRGYGYLLNIAEVQRG